MQNPLGAIWNHLGAIQMQNPLSADLNLFSVKWLIMINHSKKTKIT